MKIPHDFEFDPGYGYTLEDLLRVEAPEAPDDFDAFWEDAFRKAQRIPLKLEVKPGVDLDGNFEIFQVAYDSYQGERIGAWMTVPRGVEQPDCGVVVGHGYAGREAPDLDMPFPKGVCIYPCARGFHLSSSLKFPGNGAEHVLTGIESRETYSHLGSVIDYWLAASVLIELYPGLADRLFYWGCSFGGGIGALLLPWDSRFKRAYLDVPSFGNHPLRLTLPCIGSANAVTQRYEAGHPEIMKVLRYFDAATAASRIRIPVFFSAALFDPGVPPPGQFAVYNALRGPKQLYLRQTSHFDFEGNIHDYRAIRARLIHWFFDSHSAASIL